jgi:hypothetical protein
MSTISANFAEDQKIWRLVAAAAKRELIPTDSYVRSSVITRITTKARMKLRSSHLGRSGPESATQATTAKMRPINVQESIVQRRCGCFGG